MMCRRVITQLKGEKWPTSLRPPVRKSNKAKYFKLHAYL